MNCFLADEAATLDLGKSIALLCPKQHFTIHLEGDLGAGKTTFSRGFLRALGHQGNVKSPTYTLVEQYNIAQRTVFHFDLYRLIDPEELDYLGLDDYFTDTSLCLIEWATQGGELLPSADLLLTFRYQDQGREVQIEALSTQSDNLIKKLNLL